ncbi:MAG: carbohydrate kinase family protein [Anaerovoracaceae bacterium]
MADITVIGGINVDIEGCPYNELILEDSNPGDITIAFGGVGRNITENIARLSGDVALVAVAGVDFVGISAKEDLSGLGVDTTNVVLLENQSTAMYLSILNDKNDMEMAICNNDILEQITPEFLKDKLETIKKSSMVVIDCNLKENILAYITDELKNVDLFLDPVSLAKAGRARDIIGRFHTIKPNRMEAEILCGIPINTEKDLKIAGQWFLDQGVKRVFISLSENGVYYKDDKSEGIIKPKNVNLISATGAGDAFSAAIVLGHIKEWTVEETAKFGMATASIALESKTAVNRSINLEEVMRRMKND